MSSYAAWIDAFVAQHKIVRGLCAVACAQMRSAFPELAEVRGWADGCEHVWLVTPSGEIVDPTVAQFGGLVEEYRPFRAGDLVRVGRCMNCGDDIHKRVERLDDPRYATCVCGDECRAALETEYG